MNRNLHSDKCPRCSKQWEQSDAIGLPLMRVAYKNELSVLGCKLRCDCGIDLFLWVRADIAEAIPPEDEFFEEGMAYWTHPREGEIDISYYNTFNTICMPAQRWAKVDPRPEGPYFMEKGSKQEEVRGRLAHREGHWREYQESLAQWYEDRDGDKPTWEYDSLECSVYWSASEDEYFKDVACTDFSSCDACLVHGRPYDFNEAEDRDNLVYYVGQTNKKFMTTSLVYFLGEDFQWHMGKVVNYRWSHAAQIWKYDVVDLSRGYTGRKLVKREDSLYGERPDWDPVVLEPDVDECPS